MKPSRNPFLRSASLAASIILTLGNYAHAAPYYWDVDGTTSGFSTVVGAWNGTNAFFGPNSSGTGGTYIANPGAANDLNIVTATTNTGTITVSGAQSASSITFASGVGAVTIASGTSITIGGTGASSGIFDSSTSAQTISTPLILNSGNTAFNFSNSSTGLLTIGAVTGTATTGNVTQTITVGSSSSGGITLNGAIADVSGSATKVALTVNNSGSGITTLSGTSSYTGATNVSAGTLNLTGSLGNTAVSVTGTLYGEGSIGTSGSLTFNNGSLLRVDGSTAGALTVGSGATGNLTLNATTNVVLDLVPAAMSAGTNTIRVLNYNGSLTGSGANLALQNATNYRNPTFSTAVANQVNLSIDSKALTWSGATGAWDINTASNWNSGADKFLQGDAVTFNDTGTTKTVAITGAIQPTSVTFNNTTGNDYSVSGAIGGATGLTKSNTGKVTLSGNNTYTGTTTVSGGTLVLSGTSATTGTLNIASGATLELQQASANPFGGLVTLTGAGTLKFNGSLGFGTAADVISLGSGALIDVRTGSVNGGASNNKNWTNNLADLNVESGANFSTSQGAVRVDSLTGAGTIDTSSGSGTGGSFTFGVDNGTGTTFSGKLTNTSTANKFNFTKTGTGTQILTGASDYTTTMTVGNGTLQVNAGGNLGATTSTLAMGTGSAGTIGTVGNLTLNTDVQVGAMSVLHNTSTVAGSDIAQLSIASGKTLTVSSLTVGVSPTTSGNTKTALAATGGGTLTVNGNAVIGVGYTASSGTATVPVDFSALGSLNVTSTGAGYLRVGYNGLDVATFTLSNTANTVNVGTLSVGETSTGGENSNVQAIMNLGGGTNVLTASTMKIGYGKGSGLFQFAGFGGSVTIAGPSSGTTDITIGNFSVGTPNNANTSSLLLAGHSATVSAGAVVVGQMSSGTSTAPKAVLTFDSGTFTATSFKLAECSGTAVVTGNTTGTVTIGGATANSAATGTLNVSGDIILATNTNSTTGATGTATGTLTINGGTVNVNTNAVSTGGIFDTTTSTTGSSATTLTLAGGTLNLNGGVIGGTTGTGKKNIGTLSFQSGTLKNVLEINGGATALTKSGTGTLILDGTNSYTGGNAVNGGVLKVNVVGALGVTSGALAMGGGQLDLNGLSHTVGAVTVTSAYGSGDTITNGSLTGTSYAASNTTGNAIISANLLVNGAAGFAKSGAGTVTLSGNNSYTGGTTISAGTLSVGASNNLGAGASNLVFDGGTLQITGNTLTSFSGIGHTVSFNATKTVGLDINASGTTFTVDQVLNQTNGGFSKSGAGTVILNQTNTYTGTTTVSAGTLTLGHATDTLYDTGLVSISGGTLNMSANSDTVGQITMSAGQINGTTGTLTTPRMDVTGTASMIGGNVNAGTANTRGFVVGSGSSSSFTLSGGTWTSNGTNPDVITNNNTGTFTIDGGSYVNAGTLQTNIGSGGTLSPATFTLTTGTATINTLTINSNNSSSSRSTTVNLDGGTMQLSNFGMGTGTSGSATFNFNGGTLKAGASTLSISGLTNGGLFVKNGGAKIDTNGYNVSIGDTLQRFSGATTDSLTKSGAGTLTLSGAASNYGGGTTIKEGTLAISGPGGNTTVTPAGSGTIVLGDTTGSAAAALNVGNSNTFANAITVQTGSSGTKSINSTASSANPILSGGVTLNDNLTINNNAASSTLTFTSNAFALNGKTLTVNSNEPNAGTVTFGSTAPITGTSASVINFGGSTTAAGKFRLNAANTFSGVATLNPSGGGGAIALELNNVNALQNATLDTGASGNHAVTFILTGTTYNIGALQGSDALDITGTNTVSVGSKAVDTVFSGAIGNSSGSGSLTKVGGNTLTLSGASTYTGGTTVSNGQLNINNAGSGGTSSAIGTGALTISGGNLDNTSGAAIVLSTNNPLNINSDFTFVGSNGANSNLTFGSGAVTLNTSHQITVGSGATLTIGGNITGSGYTLTKAGAGTLVLTGSSAYTGATQVNNGVLSFANVGLLNSGSGVTLANGTSLVYTGANGTLSPSVTVTTGGTGTIQNTGGGILTLGALSKNGSVLVLKGGSGGIQVDGVISGSSANSDLVVDGGTTTLTNVETYNGPTYIRNGGKLVMDKSGSNVGLLPSGTALILDDTGSGSSTFQISSNGGNQTIASLSGASTSTIDLDNKHLTVGDSSSTIYAGKIIGGNSSELIKVGGGTLTLSGDSSVSPNNFKGLVRITAGAISVNSVEALGERATARTLYMTNGGTLQTTATMTFNTRIFDLGAGGGQFEVANGTTLTTAGAIQGAGDLTKKGPGTMVLPSGGIYGSYSGNTNVTGGKLVVNGNVSTSLLTTVSSGTLAGTGTVGAALIQGGATLEPGDGGAGTLTVNNTTLGLNDTSILNFDFNPLNQTVGTNINDLVTGINGFTLDGVLNVTATSGDFMSATNGTAWRLFNYTGSLTNNGITLGSMPSLNTGLNWSIDTSIANQVNLVVVPEPDVATLIGGLGMLCLLRRRR